jgi:hypothetical protein
MEINKGQSKKMGPGLRSWLRAGRVGLVTLLIARNLFFIQIHPE